MSIASRRSTMLVITKKNKALTSNKSKQIKEVSIIYSFIYRKFHDINTYIQKHIVIICQRIGLDWVYIY